MSGTVTIDGEPVTAGEVLFISEDGKWSASSPLSAEGTFVVKEPPVGIVKIAVQTEAFRPSEAERAWAAEVLAAVAADPRGALRVAGALVDKPVIERAQRIAAVG